MLVSTRGYRKIKKWAGAHRAHKRTSVHLPKKMGISKKRAGQPGALPALPKNLADDLA